MEVDKFKLALDGEINIEGDLGWGGSSNTFSGQVEVKNLSGSYKEIPFKTLNSKIKINITIKSYF